MLMSSFLELLILRDQKVIPVNNDFSITVYVEGHVLNVFKYGVRKVTHRAVIRRECQQLLNEQERLDYYFQPQFPTYQPSEGLGTI